MSAPRVLLGSVILAHFLLFLSFFLFKDFFWPFFTASLLLLGTLSIRYAKWKAPSIRSISYGIGSGVLLYLIFFIGKTLMLALFPQSITQLEELYQLVAPEQGWHYFSLIFVIIPGEELFWRGLIQDQVVKTKLRYPIILAAILYMSAHIYAGALLLLVAALLAGTVWGYLYRKTSTITTPLLSHLIFDLLLLIIFPLL
ncbi:MAG: CPBP family intramembrane glutamic endopeptidase [Anaerobacillus sp.]